MSLSDDRPTPAGNGLVRPKAACVVAATGEGGELATGDVSLSGAVVAPAVDRLVGAYPACMRTATGNCDERVAFGGSYRWACIRYWRWLLFRGRIKGAATGDYFGVDVEQAAVRVEQCFLGDDQPVAGFDVFGGGDGGERWRLDARRGQAVFDTAAGDHFGVDVEQAAVGVEQRFLGDDKLVAVFHLLNGLCRGSRCQGRRYEEPGCQRQSCQENYRAFVNTIAALDPNVGRIPQGSSHRLPEGESYSVQGWPAVGGGVDGGPGVGV